jgi:hypothetical protein
MSSPYSPTITAGAGKVLNLISGQIQDAPVSAPSGGGDAIFGRASGGDFKASYADRGSCMEEMLRAMQYMSLLGTGSPNNPFAIDTPQVPDGHYWFVHALSVEFVSGAGSSNANILLMPPNLAGAPANISVTDGVRIDSQNAVSGGTVQINPNGVSVQRNFVIPPRWFVRFLGKQGAGGPAQYAMRLVYAELPLSFDSLELLG